MERELVDGALAVVVVGCVWLILKVRQLKNQVGKLSSELDEQTSRILDLEIEQHFGGEKGEEIKAFKEERMRKRREEAETPSSSNGD